MKITIEHNETVTTISAQVETIDEVFDTIIKPALYAVGYHPETVARCFVE